MTARRPHSDPPEYYDVDVDDDTAQSDRRKKRFDDAVGIVRERIKRPAHNCAEACAVSIARAYLDDGEDVEDLVFITFAPEYKGPEVVKDPCDTCKEWIKQEARAYCDRDGRFHCR